MTARAGAAARTRHGQPTVDGARARTVADHLRGAHEDVRDSLGATFVVVTHELASIFTIADNSVFLDPNTRTMRAQGNPRELLKNSTDPAVQVFLTRGAASAQPTNAKPSNLPVL